MLNLERILGNDRLLRATTGLNRKAFEELLPSFAEAYQQHQMQASVKCKRAPRGGRRATLRTMHDKLFYILLSCKCYPTFDLMSVLFGFDRSCAWDWVHGLLPILEQALGYKQALPERKLRSMEEFLERFLDVKVVILDGTERPVQLPKTQSNRSSITPAKRNGIRASTLRVIREQSESSC